MYFHGSNIGDLKILKPKIYKMGDPYRLFFSSKRQNVFPYLANPLQVLVDKKYGKDVYKMTRRIAAYNIDENGVIVFSELWSGMFEEIFKGQTGYIYYFDDIDGIQPLEGIKDQYVVDHRVDVDKVEVVSDIYAELQKMECDGIVKMKTYDQLSAEKKEKWQDLFLNDYKRWEDVANEDLITKLYCEILEDKFEKVKQYKKEKAKTL